MVINWSKLLEKEMSMYKSLIRGIEREGIWRHLPSSSTAPREKPATAEPLQLLPQLLPRKSHHIYRMMDWGSWCWRGPHEVRREILLVLSLIFIHAKRDILYPKLESWRGSAECREWRSAWQSMYGRGSNHEHVKALHCLHLQCTVNSDCSQADAKILV